MEDGLEGAYLAVEEAYGQGEFSAALQLAVELRDRITAGRDDLLDHRLNLLIGHIHGFGLGQPAEAAAAYTQVLATCSNPAYRDLASQGLARTGRGSGAASVSAATPWLQDIQATSPAPLTLAPERTGRSSSTGGTERAASAIRPATARRFSESEWDELSRCLLVVELSDSPDQPAG
jgi:hypothetical protein